MKLNLGYVIPLGNKRKFMTTLFTCHLELHFFESLIILIDCGIISLDGVNGLIILFYNL